MIPLLPFPVVLHPVSEVFGGFCVLLKLLNSPPKYKNVGGVDCGRGAGYS